MISFGLIILLLASFKKIPAGILWLNLSIASLSLGIILYSIILYRGQPVGIKNNNIWFDGISSRKLSAWILAMVLTLFYCLLYWWPEYLGFSDIGNSGLVAFFDPLSQFLKKQPANQLLNDQNLVHSVRLGV